MPKQRRYWLFKSEPDCYSIDDLQADGETYWDGVRNYQARNMLRDDVQVGDRVLFYHSNAKPMGVVGSCRVVRAGYADHTAFDEAEGHYDPKSDPENPTWFMVDVKHLATFGDTVTREQLRESTATAEMKVLAKGSRLSIQPVTEDEWHAVHALAGVKPK